MKNSKVYEEIKIAICKGDVKKIKELTKGGKYLLLKGMNGNTPLHIAALCGNREVCRVLLENLSEKIEKKFEELLAKFGYDLENLEIGEIFDDEFALEEERIINWFSSRFKNKQGKSPAHLAAEVGNVAFIEVLLEVHNLIPILNTEDNFGNLPVHIAAAKGNLEVIKLLLNSIDKENVDGNTPLHIATKSGHKEVVKLLVVAGANLEVENRYGLTPSSLAELYGQKEIAEFLNSIEKGKLAEDIVFPSSLRKRIPRIFIIGCGQINDYLEIVDDFSFSLTGGNDGKTGA